MNHIDIKDDYDEYLLQERVNSLRSRLYGLKKNMLELGMISPHDIGNLKKCCSCDFIGCIECIHRNNEIVFEICCNCNKSYCIYKCKDKYLKLRHDGKYECKDLNKCYNIVVKFE